MGTDRSQKPGKKEQGVMRKLLSTVGLGAVLLTGSVGTALAQDPVAEPEAQAVEPVDPNTGALSFTGAVSFTNAYFYRGYLQEDEGFIAQPSGQMNIALVDSEDGIDLTGYVGLWASLHSEQTLTTGSNDIWYETDAYGGLTMTTGQWSLGLLYTFYTYPSGAFGTIEELGLTAGFNDTEAWGGGFSLAPTAGIYVETSDANGTEDTYAEIGIAPGVYSHEGSGLSLSVPVKIGLSIDDYYFDNSGDDEVLGYGSIGLAAALPLSMPSQYGSWTLSASVTYLALFADGLETINDGDSGEFIAAIGIGFTY
jgi:hypothetical protein